MNDWLRLKYVADVITSNVDKLSKDEEIPVRLVNYTDVYYRDRLTPDLPLMRATASPPEIAKYGLANGDIIITKDSETADDIGVAAYVERADADMLCGYHLSRIRTDGSVALSRYVFWVLASNHARDQMSIAATGVTRFGLRADAIRNLLIRIPSMLEQRAIADYLDVETCRIDTLISRNDAHDPVRGGGATSKLARLVELLGERRQAMITAAVTGQLAIPGRAD